MKQNISFLRRYTKIFLFIYVFTLFILYATLSILRHMHFQSGGFDLGLYDQAVWKFGHGFDLYNTVKGRIIFGDHLVLTLPFLSPLLYIWNDVRVLLIVQTFSIALSTIPIYFIALKRISSHIVSWTVTILYSLFFGIQFGVFFDFHPIILGVSLLAFLCWSIEYGKKRLFWFFLVLSLLTQENMGIAVACVGMCYLLRLSRSKREERITAIMLMFIGIFYSILALKITALFSPIGYEYTPVFPHSIGEYLKQLFDSEEKQLTWLYSYSWFSFVPLLSPGSLMAVVTDLSQYYATGVNYSRMWSPFMHHRAILSIFLTLGLLDILTFLSRWKRICIIICCLLLLVAGTCQYQFHFALNKLVKAEYWKEESWMKDDRELIALVPHEVSVATQQNLVPHLSHRKEIYLIYPRQKDTVDQPCGQKLCWWLDFSGKPAYLVVDTRPGQWLTQTLESDDHWLSAIANMEKSDVIRLEKQIGGARMYKVMNNE